MINDELISLMAKESSETVTLKSHNQVKLVSSK